MPRTAITGGIPTSHLPFSPAIRAGNFVFVSGQASVDDTGAYIEGSFADELDRSFSNVARILATAGGSLDDVVQVRAYLGDITYRDEFNSLYKSYFSPPMPARTTLSGGLGQLKFEIDVVAYTPGLSSLLNLISEAMAGTHVTGETVVDKQATSLVGTAGIGGSGVAPADCRGGHGCPRRLRARCGEHRRWRPA